MTAEEEIAQLKQERAAERAKSARLEGELARELAENAQLRQMMEEILRSLGEVEGKLAKDSHNSSRPPSSDGLLRKRVNLRKKSEKKPGGQAGHPGRMLLAVETPDEVVRHRPVVCRHCQQPLEEVPCPAHGQQNVGTFPVEVMAPVQYGPHVQALAVHLHQGQLLTMARTCELLEEVCGCHLSQGTRLAMGAGGIRATCHDGREDCYLAKCGALAARR